MNKTATIYHRDGRERTVDIHEASRLVGTGEVGADKEWSFHKPPPPGWEREIPKYRATRDVHPAPKARFRFEPPFASITDSDEWQYGTRAIEAGEIVETKDWPHPSFIPLNYGAEKVLAFFNSQMKSRMQRSPWNGDCLRLDNGLFGNVIDAARVVPPQLKQIDRRAS